MANIVRADKQGAPGKFWRARATGYGYKEVGAIRDTVLVAAQTTDASTSILASGDVIHTTILNFADVVAENGQSGVITKMLIIDDAAQATATELWLFKQTVTIPAGNAAWSITDAHADLCVGVIRTATDGVWFASALNAVAVVNGGLTLPMAFTCDAADVDLYGALVTRATPTYTAVTDLRVVLTIDRD